MGLHYRDGGSSATKVRVPGSYTGLRKVGGREHVDVWDYPVEWEGKGAPTAAPLMSPGMEAKRVSLWCGNVRPLLQGQGQRTGSGLPRRKSDPFEIDITEALAKGPNTIEIQGGSRTARLRRYQRSAPRNLR